ncbi:MAG: phage holin family protein [Altererythrobacter sp.]|nr:phage holin family protein [Altererythrobacter sp.]
MGAERPEPDVRVDRAELPPDVPDDFDPEPADPAVEPSLLDDLKTLLGDGKNYVEAELAFQTSRAGHTAALARLSAVYLAVALALVHLALIALVVGLVFALSPLVGPWLATGIVVGLLLAGALVLVQRLRAKLSEIRGMYSEQEP